MYEPFHLRSGEVIADVDALEPALVRMSEEDFAFHATHRNDFADWIEGSHAKPLLAALLRECETAHEMAIVLETYRVLRQAPQEELLVSDVVRRLLPRFS